MVIIVQINWNIINRDINLAFYPEYENLYEMLKNILEMVLIGQLCLANEISLLYQNYQAESQNFLDPVLAKPEPQYKARF